MPVDGNDVLAVYEMAKEAVQNCRSGNGPVLIEAKTYRQGGHHVNDPGTYMPEEKLEYFKAKDPVKIGRQYLVDQGKFSEKEIADIEAEVGKEMDEAIEFAKDSPEPSVEEFLEEAACYRTQRPQRPARAGCSCIEKRSMKPSGKKCAAILQSSSLAKVSDSGAAPTR